MAHTALYLIVGAALAGALLVLSMRGDTLDANEHLADYQHDVLARDPAVTGLHLTVRRLAADIGPWTNGANYSFSSTPFGSGSFSVTVMPVDGADTVDVTAVGHNGPGTQIIDARYAREYADGGIPPAFRNAITTDNFLQLRGNVYIGALDDSLNASIHTNGTLETSGNSFTVEGYGTYTGSVDTNQPDNFQPNIDYNGEDEPNVFWSDSVHIPPIDLDKLRASATLITTGDASLSNETRNFSSWATTLGKTAGTADNPFIWVVEGNLTLESMYFDGYGMIVAVGDLETKSNIVGGIDENLETMLGLFAAKDPNTGDGGNIDIRGNDQINATFYADGRVTMHGTPDLVGGIVAPDTHFQGRGNMSVTYASASETITDPGFEYIIPIGPVLIAYSEWRCLPGQTFSECP